MNRSQAIQLLPPYQNRKDILATYGTGNNPGLVKDILDQWPKAVAQTRRLAPSFQKGNMRDSARAVWDFLKTQIRYKEDPWTGQFIKLPSALIATGFGDCKSYALFSGAILANLGYPVRLRFAGYNGSRQPGHVYAVAGKDGNDVIVDAVWKSFDSEKRPDGYKKDYKMEISVISGIGCTNCGGAGCAGCIGKAQIFKKVATAAKNIVEKGKAAAKAAAKGGAKGLVKSAVLMAPRTAFLQLVKLNVHGFATKLAARRDEANAKWKQLGGNTGDLGHAISEGVKRKAILGIWEQYNAGTIGSNDNIGVVAETTAALLAAAAPIIAALAALLGRVKNEPTQQGTPTGTQTGDGEGTSTKDDYVKQALEMAANTLQKFTQNQQSAPAPQYGGGESYSQSSPQSNAMQTDAAPSQTPGWVLPAAIVAAFLLLK